MSRSHCRIFQFYLTIALVHSMIIKDEPIEDTEGNIISNPTKLLYEYFLLCGSSYFCHPHDVGFGSHSINTRDIKICEECECNRGCTEKGNCCADVIFAIPLPVCVSPSVNNGKLTEHPDNVFMINSCLNNTDENLQRQCMATDIIVKAGHVEFPPVTSQSYRQTFKNKFCAECNGVFQYNDWSLAMDCPELTDFNFLSTFDEIIDKAESLECTVGFSTVDDDIHYCDADYVVVSSTSKCNKTGTWATYDNDIDLACNSAYSVRYGMYDNIFCFMCNPPDYRDGVISSCNVTGLLDHRVESVEQACVLHAQSRNAVPYKNIFCFLCNRNNSHSSPYFDVYIDSMNYDMFTTDEYGTDKLTFVYSFSFKSYNLAFHNTIIESTNMKISTKDELIGGKAWSVNRTKLLLYDYSVTGYYRYCRQDVVPYIVGEYQCSCNPLCFFDNSLECCLDLALEYPISCQRPKLATEGPSHYFIDGCFQSTWPDNIQSRCRLSDDDIYAAMPISGENDMLYKNFDCFLCNQDIALSEVGSSKRISPDIYLPWSINMRCESDLNLRYHTTMYDVIGTGKRNRCNVGISSSEIEHGKSCKQTSLGKEECNTTGYWREFDQDITWACEDSPLQSQHDLYRNVFCFICNPQSTTNTTDSMRSCTSTDHQLYGAEISRACREATEVDSMFPAKNIFCQYCNINDSKIPLPWPIRFKMYNFMSKQKDMILDVSKHILQDLFRPYVNKLVKEQLDVNGTHIFDPITSRPRRLTCYPGKSIDGTECVPLLRTTTNLKYTMALSLEGIIHTAEQATTLLTDTKQKVLSEINTKLAIREIHVLLFHITSNVSCEISNMTEPIASHLLIQTTFTITDVVERLTTEQILLNLTKDNMVISNVTFRSRPASEAYILPSVPGSNFDGYCIQNVHFHGKYWITLPYVRTTLVSDIMISRQVALGPDEYSIKLETLELSVKHSSKKFHQDRYLRMPDGNVQLCLDDYLDIINEYMAGSGYDSVREALSVTTFVCTVVSLVCLFLTFCTYLLFRTMRSVPGVNNMSLVFAMFFSQGFFQFGFDRTSIPSLCMSIGVFTHYFWLATFTCMNVCSYHMYSVFAMNTLAGRSSNTRKRIALYVLYSYGAPLVVVAANIITSYVISVSNASSSGLTEIGYGGGACFISNNVSLYATFLTPVVLICVSNMFMFVTVAIKIRNTPKVESSKDRRLDFVIYIKLFTITGVTWILVVIDTFLPLSVFSFIVTILTGCQGLLIFFSFVWNQRVLSLYRTLFCKTKRNQAHSAKYSTRSAETVSSSM